MKYLVIDSGFMHGGERNPVFGTNDKKEAFEVADESGEGMVVINRSSGTEVIIYVSSFNKELELPE